MPHRFVYGDHRHDHPEEKYKTRVELEDKFEQRDEYEYDFTFARGDQEFESAHHRWSGPPRDCRTPCMFTHNFIKWLERFSSVSGTHKKFVYPVDQAVFQGWSEVRRESAQLREGFYPSTIWTGSACRKSARVRRIPRFETTPSAYTAVSSPCATSAMSTGSTPSAGRTRRNWRSKLIREENCTRIKFPGR